MRGLVFLGLFSAGPGTSKSLQTVKLAADVDGLGIRPMRVPPRRRTLFFTTMEKIHCSECGKLMVSVAIPPYCPACLTKGNPIPEKSGAPWPLAGRQFIVKADGVRSMNGKLAGHTFFGDIHACPPDMTVWDVMRAIIDNAEE